MLFCSSENYVIQTLPQTRVKKTIHLSSHLRQKIFHWNPKEMSSSVPFFVWWSWAPHSPAGIDMSILCKGKFLLILLHTDKWHIFSLSDPLIM